MHTGPARTSLGRSRGALRGAPREPVEPRIRRLGGTVLEAERSQPSDFGPTSSDTGWQDASSDESPEDRRMLISFGVMLVAFKLLGIVVIIAYLGWTGLTDVVAFIVATNVPFVLVGLGLLYVPLSRLYRRLRLRRRRRRLIWSEWNVEESSTQFPRTTDP